MILRSGRISEAPASFGSLDTKSKTSVCLSLSEEFHRCPQKSIEENEIFRDSVSVSLMCYLSSLLEPYAGKDLSFIEDGGYERSNMTQSPRTALSASTLW